MRKRWVMAAGAVLVLAAAYSGYWFWLARQLNRDLDAWIGAWRALGYRIDAARAGVSGFPLALRLDIGDLTIASPPAPRHWTWTKLVGLTLLEVEPWRPLVVAVTFSGSHRLELADGPMTRTLELSARAGTAVIDLAPAGQAEQLALGASDIRMSEPGVDATTIGSAHVIARLPPTPPVDHTESSADFDFALDDVMLPPTQAGPLGSRIATIEFRGRLMGSVPMGRLGQSLARWREAGGTVELTRVDGAWGPLGITASGTMALDQALQPVAAGTARVRGYAEAIDKAVAAGFMTPSEGLAAKLALGATAPPAAGGGAADVPVTIQNGFLSVGPLPLLQMPHIEWW
jgi:hypothetical protein